ncbi:MAG: family 10 glycosylhydrolase [Lentisphaeria bacterium]|nr:family 10 glycosylhydrolase [Lentisphaeria bacterium]
MKSFLRKIFFFSTLFLTGCLSAAPRNEVLKDKQGRPVRLGGKLSPAQVLIPAVYHVPAAELRGVWISTVENLDFPRQQSAAAAKALIAKQMQNLKARNFNAVFFQVRPNNDAFYPSRLNPWSRWLTGTEGKGIAGLDPLQCAVTEAHRNGLEFHAWLNPYRVIGRTKLSKSAYLASLAPGNFARNNPEMVLSVELGKGERLLFLNPAEPAVRRHVLESIREIALRYPVDAIHFDDYFYPYDGMGNVDQHSFRKYNPRKLSLADWRRSNVDALISQVKPLLDECRRKTGRQVRFGISPFGIWGNRKNFAAGSLTAGKESYSVQYADTRGWVKKGYLDYIVPQIYWHFGHDVAAYGALTDWWADQVAGTGCDLYIGMAVYRCGSAQWSDPAELLHQIRFNTKYPTIKGQVFFRYESVVAPSNPAMRSAMAGLQKYWRHPVPVRAAAAGKKYPRFR